MNRLRRFSFSLRFLMLCVLVSVVVLAIAASMRRRVERQKIIAEHIKESGGEVFHSNIIQEREPNAPQWLLDRLGVDTFEGLGQIELQNSDIDDISFLSKLPGVQNIFLDGTKVADLSPLSPLTSLQFLSLDHTPVADLSPLQNLRNLETLSISDTNVADLTALHGLSNLKTLYARRTAATDEELNRFRSALPNVRINP